MSDILTIAKNNTFYIETKMKKSQAGQFVLYPNKNSKTFIFSKNNKSDENEYTNTIIKHMNENFEKYKNTKRKGEYVDISPNIAFSWIINNYLSKNVSFFAITNKENIVIFPVEKISQYCTVKTIYRVKQSGSCNPSKKDMPSISKKLMQNNIKHNLIINGKKVLINTKNDISDISFYIDNYKYIFKRKDENLYEIRKLSNTANANVIFSIECVSEQRAEDLQCFIDTIS